MSVYLLLQAVVLWQLAALARTNPAQVRPTILSMTVASIVNAVLTWHSIFPVPAVFGAVVTAFLVAAIIAAGSDATPLATR